jgi:hypothetical protein
LNLTSDNLVDILQVWLEKSGLTTSAAKQASTLLTNSVAPTTLNSYLRSFSLWSGFCAKQDVALSGSDLVMKFVTEGVQHRQWKKAYCEQVLDGIRFILNLFKCDFEWRVPPIKRLLKGVDRLYEKPMERGAITPSLWVKKVLNLKPV